MDQHEVNQHRWFHHVSPKTGKPSSGVACSAAGCRWAGPSVAAFYRDHLYPMLPKLKDSAPSSSAPSEPHATRLPE